MEKINHHIKTLLSTHDCVIIPNFGAFIADYSPAVVTDEKSTIPGKDILFNRNLTRNDGLLINALLEEDDLDYPQAKQEVERYVIAINAALAKGEKINLEGVGELMLDEAGFIQFIADESNSCLLDSYGLEPITLEKIKSQEMPPVEKAQRKTLNRSTRIVMRVASVAAVVALLLIFAIPLSDEPIGDYASLGFDSSTPIVVTNSTPATELKEGSTTAVPNTTKTPLPQANVEVTPSPLSRKATDVKSKDVITPQKTYHIIIASLANEQSAKQYVQTFKTKHDFDALEMMSGDGRYRISVAHFDQKQEALAFVKSLRLLNPTFDDAWVLPQTLN